MPARLSGDLVQMGDVLREADRPDEALAKYNEAVKLMDASQLPEPVKAATRRNHLFEETRVAVAKNDLATAKARLAEYTGQIAPRNAPFEVRQQHELAGLIAPGGEAVRGGRRGAGTGESARSAGAAADGAGGAGCRQRERASALAKKAAHFNELSFNFAYVKKRAERFSGMSL